jgi:hypothetical protein
MAYRDWSQISLTEAREAADALGCRDELERSVAQDVAEAPTTAPDGGFRPAFIFALARRIAGMINAGTPLDNLPARAIEIYNLAGLSAVLSAAPGRQRPLKLTELTSLILNLNAAIDSGRHADVTMAEAKQHIEAGDVFPWLRNRGVHFHILEHETASEITKHFKSIQGGYGGNEWRKWCVQNSGLCLLLAWTNELIQLRSWKDDGSGPDDEPDADPEDDKGEGWKHAK